jgi:hypothetical protein
LGGVKEERAADGFEEGGDFVVVLAETFLELAELESELALQKDEFRCGVPRAIEEAWSGIRPEIRFWPGALAKVRGLAC